MKSIETHYAGCLFRSRLEARWAVFFDALEVPWRYELDGVELASGTRYLPDFWLPSIEVWLEVKAQLHPIDVKWREFHDEVNAGDEFAAASFVGGTGQRRPAGAPYPNRTFMIGSPPPPVTGLARNTVEHVDAFACMLGPGSPHAGWAWGFCPECYEPGLDVGHVAWPTELHCRHFVEIQCDHPRIHAALRAARSAQFEFGRSGPR